MCSRRGGWRSLLLRGYDDPPQVEEFTTPATNDHLIVLVTRGACDIEAQYQAGWERARYRRGFVGMTAPGEAVTLRWHGMTSHSTLQLHLPESMIKRIEDELLDESREIQPLRSTLGLKDPLIEQVMAGLSAAARARAPDLYAETAGELLAMHILGGHKASPSSAHHEDRRLQRVDTFMRENMARPLTLEMLAAEAGISRFHLLRVFRRAYGESPLRRLTRFRMEQAKLLLRSKEESITTIAALCGYENPSHFATAFRRLYGMSPRDYRKQG